MLELLHDPFFLATTLIHGAGISVLTFGLFFTARIRE